MMQVPNSKANLICKLVFFFSGNEYSRHPLMRTLLQTATHLLWTSVPCTDALYIETHHPLNTTNGCWSNFGTRATLCSTSEAAIDTHKTTTDKSCSFNKVSGCYDHTGGHVIVYDCWWPGSMCMKLLWATAYIKFVRLLGKWKIEILDEANDPIVTVKSTKVHKTYSTSAKLLTETNDHCAICICGMQLGNFLARHGILDTKWTTIIGCCAGRNLKSQTASPHQWYPVGILSIDTTQS